MRFGLAHPARAATGKPALCHSDGSEWSRGRFWTPAESNRGNPSSRSRERQREGRARLQLHARRAVSAIRLLLQHMFKGRCPGPGWSDVSLSWLTGSPIGVSVAGRPGVRHQHHCLADHTKTSQTRLLSHARVNFGSLTEQNGTE